MHINIRISLTISVKNKKENFQNKLSVLSVNTRNKHHLHTPNTNLHSCQESALYARIRIFDN
jgi:hypothetical protein